ITLPGYMDLLLVMTHATKVIILGKAHKNITTHKGGGFLSEIKLTMSFIVIKNPSICFAN
ncbi:hypothetical protein EZS27_015841, partial [termite gut metagenome]